MTYEVDDRDTVRVLSGVPDPNGGAPLPHLVVAEGRATLAYIVSDPDPSWDGTPVSVGSETPDLPIAVLSFKGVLAHMFGYPNDEAFSGHPLAKRGLRPYRAAVIEHSSWVRRLDEMNSVHPRHVPGSFGNRTHFVFPFHDSMFECIAFDFTVAYARGSMASVLGLMASRLSGGAG